RKRAYCLKIQPATGSFARNLIYSTKPYVCRKKLRKRRTINTQLTNTDWLRQCLQEQVICHGKANQKYRLILVFKPFLLVSMIQRLSKKLGNSTTLGNYGLCPAALI
ncbi:hypothetical protein, partial [Escherichia coli]|uniref:hypothetical protein n=1 Tax=Escherichia coli TaxID=562 RepID=UPI001C52E23D